MGRTTKQTLGAWGEQQAVNFLLNKQYTIVERNVTYKHVEIDIIAQCAVVGEAVPTICFIEVKTRSNDLGSAEKATDKQKLSNMMTGAKIYCLQHQIDIDRQPIRFEQISVYRFETGKVVVRHYEIPV